MVVRFKLLAIGWFMAANSVACLGQDIVTGFPQATRANLAQPIAVSGDPFGVLMAELPLPPEFVDREPRILIEDSAGRIFYPVISVRTVEMDNEPVDVVGRRGGLIDRLRAVIRRGNEKHQMAVSVQVAALYRGDGPIELKLVGDIQQTIRIVPTSSTESEKQKFLKDWWTQYTTSAIKDIQGTDFPKLVHKYLTAMLASRLGLPRVDLDPPDPDKEKKLSEPLETLALLAAIEPLREEILEDVINYAGDLSPANLPVPAAPIWEPAILPPVNGQAVTESLASRVPPECFYLRFGAFSNYLWFQGIGERYGGDMAQAVLLRGFNYDASARMERMLASKLTTISKMFGDKLIGDMAVFGSDLYLKEGAGVGILFLATNPELLNLAMEADRRAAAAKNKAASLQEIVILGKRVSLLSTPDNRVRSFYVQEGPFVCVTTSETLVRRFLEVGAGDQSLAATEGFQLARTWMPEANDYSVFGYFSPEFFHHLVSPQYQIELRRRLEAIAHLEIAEMASQAAIAEGRTPDDIGQLQSAGLLPAWFDQRSDGSKTLRSSAVGGSESWIDSRRGARGSFLPIVDVPLVGVTQGEAERYAKLAEFYQQQWRHMDPMLMGLRRFKADANQVEKVTFEAFIAPFEAEKYGWIAKQLGEPTPLEIGLPADDVVSVQVHVRGRNGLAGKIEDYHLFAGIKDMKFPAAGEVEGLFKTIQFLQVTPAYIGAWPKPGLVELLPFGLGRSLATADIAGFSRMIGGLWRWQDGSFSLLSFDRSILENAIPQLSVRETTDFAQGRLSIDNLSGTQLAASVNDLWYQRGWKSSHANSHLLDTIQQQLKVPSLECMDAAQRLLDVRLQCPLGGKYQVRALPAGGGGWWESSAWSEAVVGATGLPSPPPNYSAPWIEWFRGAKVHVTQGPGSLALVGECELEMQPLPVDLSPSMPSSLPSMNFDLFGLPMRIFGGSVAAEAKAERKSF